MELSPDLKTSRLTRLTSSKQSTNFSLISKSLTVSQSQGKVLERYFYRRESAATDKIDPIPIKKIKLQKINSFHDQSHPSKSAKNTITNGNEDLNEAEFVQIPNFHSCKQQEVKHEEEQNQDRMSKIFRRTSDWSVFTNKNGNLLSKGKKKQSSEIKLNLNRRSAKEKGSFSRASGQANMQLVLKKHKADNVRQIDQKMRSVMSRCGLFDSEKLITMREYNRKCGYEQDTRVFIWNSEDEHIRRILLGWGWIQNGSNQSPFFHLKWTYMPNFQEQPPMKEKQMINHFKNTHEITTKSSLTKNLKFNESSFGKIDRYYPKCFDVGNQSQWFIFMEEYRHNIMLILLKKVYQLFCEKKPNEMRNFDLFYNYHLKRDPYGETQAHKKRKSILRNKGFRQIQMQDYKKRSPDFLVQANLVVEISRYWRNFRKQKEEFQDQSYHFLAFDPSKFNDNFADLEKYASFRDLVTPRNEVNFTKEMYSTPSVLLLQRISKEYNFCKCTQNLFPTYGTNNVWIVKPTSNSRGSGIYLTSDLQEIQTSTKGIQSRLVQKYIQRPLLIKNKKWKQIYMKKFDIRQWVLLKSIDPLEVYIFSQCYLRLCYDSYNIDQINDLSRHLTNYSINKQKFKNKNESVLPLAYLKDLLMQQFKIDWHKTIRPQIENIIIKSIRSCVETLEDCGGSCFQMFGYDILLDQQLRPWLLEINMSPACEQRTPWLTEYLNDMGSGLLALILPSQLEPGAVGQGKYKWQLILREQTALNRKKEAELGLEVVGTSVGLNFQKEVDIHLLQQKMAFKIQRFFREYLPNYKVYKGKRLLKQKKICNYLRSFQEYIYFKSQEKNSNLMKVKKYLRSLVPQTLFLKKTTSINVECLSRYLNGAVKELKYQQYLQRHRAIVILSQARTLIMIRKLSNFSAQLINTNQKVQIIQKKIRDFLCYREVKKRNLQKYFKTLLSIQKFQEKELKCRVKINTQTIFRYFKSALEWKTCQKAIVLAKKRLIVNYLSNLVDRQQFYSKRIQIFMSLVGRVVRVARRRTRCEHFKRILQSWKDEVQQQKQKIIEIENSRLRKIMQASKQKNAKNLEEGKMNKFGTIRPNKRQ